MKTTQTYLRHHARQAARALWKLEPGDVDPDTRDLLWALALYADGDPCARMVLRARMLQTGHDPFAPRR